MKLEDVKVGMKVIVNSKSALGEKCSYHEWLNSYDGMFYIENGYAEVDKIYDDGDITLGKTFGEIGFTFKACDLEPFEEVKANEKDTSLDSLFEKGLKANSLEGFTDEELRQELERRQEEKVKRSIEIIGQLNKLIEEFNEMGFYIDTLDEDCSLVPIKGVECVDRVEGWFKIKY